MPIKYTKEDSANEAASDRARGIEAQRRFQRFSSAPPSRRALSWIIMVTALIVTVLMIVSELPYLDSTAPTPVGVSLDGTVISNEAPDGERILRVEIPGSDDTPPHVYDISLDDRPQWESIRTDDAVRIQVQLDDEGNIKQITGVESLPRTLEDMPTLMDETIPD